MIVSIISILLFIFGISIYHHNYPKISDDNLITYMEQSTLDDHMGEGDSDFVVEELKNIGFTNIEVKAISDEKLEGATLADRKLLYVMLGNEQLNTVVDYQENLSERRIRRDTPIVLYYKNFPNNVLGFQYSSNVDAKEILDRANTIGFTNVILKFDSSSKLQSETDIVKILINDKELFNPLNSSPEETRYFFLRIPQ